MGKYKNKLLSIEAVRWNGLNVDEVKNLVDDISKSGYLIYHIPLHYVFNHISSTLVWFIILLI